MKNANGDTMKAHEELISIVIISHNSRPELDACLNHLLSHEQPGTSTELIIVDSGSTQDRPTADRADHFLALRNVGYGTAANYGACVASGDWIVIMNPDVRVTAFDLVKLRDLAERERLSMIAPSLSNSDGSGFAHYSSLPTPPWRQRATVPPSGSTAVHSALALVGAVLLIQRQVFCAVGGFDQGYFLYFEEIDLAERLASRGYRIGWTRTVTATHHLSSSSTGVTAPWRVAQEARGKARYLRRKYGFVAAVVGIFADMRAAHRKLSAVDLAKASIYFARDPRRSLHALPSPLL